MARTAESFIKNEDVPAVIKERVRLHGVYISPGNRKLGKIPNFSLRPGLDCPGKTPLCTKFCYAKQAFSYSNDCKVNWSVNGQQANNKFLLDRAGHDIIRWLYEKKPALFRIHVAGDFVSMSYSRMWEEVAAEFPKTQFLAFTKVFDNSILFKPYFGNNVNIIWSVWPDTDFSKIPPGPRAYCDMSELGYEYPESERERLSKALRCEGACESCGICFHSNDNQVDVVMKAHGPSVSNIIRSKTMKRDSKGRFVSG